MKRNVARHLGLKIYEPDAACPRGHRQRYVSTGSCVACQNGARSRATRDALVKVRRYAVPQDRYVAAMAAAARACTAVSLEVRPIESETLDNGFVVLVVPYEAVEGHGAIDAVVNVA
ncbi:MAG: hypothetical protein RSG92_15355 [Pseudomonas sp.]